MGDGGIWYARGFAFGYIVYFCARNGSKQRFHLYAVSSWVFPWVYYCGKSASASVLQTKLNQYLRIPKPASRQIQLSHGINVFYTKPRAWFCCQTLRECVSYSFFYFCSAWYSVSFGCHFNGNFYLPLHLCGRHSYIG